MKVIQGILAMDEGKAMLKQVGDQTDLDRVRLKGSFIKQNWWRIPLSLVLQLVVDFWDDFLMFQR